MGSPHSPRPLSPIVFSPAKWLAPPIDITPLHLVRGPPKSLASKFARPIAEPVVVSLDR